MYLVKSKAEIHVASDFITGTCQLIPKRYSSSYDPMHDLVTTEDTLLKQYIILCGSRAEFYIRPLNICIEDADYLLCSAEILAFSGDFPVLPSDIDLSGLADVIECYEIKPCHGFPGFVRLRSLGVLRYNWKHKVYKFSRNINPDNYIKIDKTKLVNKYRVRLNGQLNEHKSSLLACGPAIKSPSAVSDSILNTGTDNVPCLFCPQWPKDAQMWPLRPRNNGWPTSRTVSEVVRNGCHVVYAQHRACRDDAYQWRLSFSVAEVILLQSWTKTQQIVYHLLRFFAKRELIKKDCPKEDEVLCPYHLKTLMLWTCENKSPEWWDSSPIIAICCELLNILSNWLKRRHCPNYFIPEANLLHHPSTSTLLHQTENRVNEFRNYDILCRCFVENYILPITRTRFQFFNTGKVRPDFMDYMLPLLEYRKRAMPIFVDMMIAVKFQLSHKFYHRAIKSHRSASCLVLRIEQSEEMSHFIMCKEMICLPTTEKILCFKYYDFLLHGLHIAYCLSKEEISWNCSLLFEFVNAVSLQNKIIRSQHHNFPKTYREDCSWYYFWRALDLMENLTGLNSRSQSQLMFLISKVFLRGTMKAEGSKSNGVTTAALVYLAALHFASSEYQEAIRLCSAALLDQTPQEEKETLNAGCLLFIEDVARIVGLCVLHKNITDINLQCTGKRLYLDLRLSPEVIAHYLTVLSFERESTHLDFGRNLPDSSFPMDKNVMALIKSKFVAKLKLDTQRHDARQLLYRRIDNLTEIEATATKPLLSNKTIIDLLMEIALENMTSFYSAILKDFGIQCNTADCYRALYLYKCLQYDEVLCLCERILNEPDLQGDIKEFSFANVLVIPPFDSLFDGDVQSLLGFHTLFYYLSPLNGDLHKSKMTNNSPFEHWFLNYVRFKKTTLSGCLAHRNFIRYHYFLGRHFLARYLKVRCYIDCGLPFKKAMTEFAAHKTALSFGLIIRRYLVRRNSIIKHLSIAKE